MSSAHCRPTRPRFPGRRLVPALVVSTALTGCAQTGLVTGRGPTAQGGQSETEATTSYSRGVHRIVVTYNDETASQTTIQYTPTTRKVLRGASLMGWSYSEDHGATWTYGGKLSPPPGWAVLWGDPAITTSRTNYGLVFISNLAFPDAKFPSGGVDGCGSGGRGPFGPLPLAVLRYGSPYAVSVPLVTG